VHAPTPERLTDAELVRYAWHHREVPYPHIWREAEAAFERVLAACSADAGEAPADPPCPYCGMTAQVEPSRSEPGRWMCHGCAQTFDAGEAPGEAQSDNADVARVAGLEAQVASLRDALKQIDAGWAPPPKGAPELLQWTQEIARAALAALPADSGGTS